MSLNISLTEKVETTQFVLDITDNLTKMAKACGIYEALWSPNKLNINSAGELIPFLEKGLQNLLNKKEEMEKFNPENGLGSYDYLLGAVCFYNEACKKYPDSKINICK